MVVACKRSWRHFLRIGNRALRVALAFTLLVLPIYSLSPKVAYAADPVVGKPVAVPSSIIANQSTQLLVTVKITGSKTPTKVILSKVNLLNLPLLDFGTMRDDGKSGDAVANDKIYTLRFTVKESNPGQYRVRAYATFSTKPKLVISDVTIIPIVAGDPNNIDNDGDGYTENQGDCNDTNSAIKPGAVEKCNGVDDNCNAQIDETFTVGGSCSAGVGACQANGTIVCSASGTSTVCSAVAGTPTTERCGTSIDEDCDGQTDEGFNVGASCSAGTGACLANGTFVCSANQLSTECNAVAGQPVTELCNGADDDCNGIVDNGFDVGGSCSAGVGLCQASGTLACAVDGSIACNAVAGTPQVEICGNGIDEDCNGSDLICAPVDQDGDGYTVAAGDCNDNNPAINPGAAEKCNGVDDNCNEATDEGFNVGTTCSAGVGACSANGSFVCSADGSTTQCNAVAGTPQAELCNGVDDDCNGTIDNGFVIGAGCSAGVGNCANNGLTVCAGDGQSTVCNATPGAPSTELCNGQDDDCNGTVDNGFDVGGSCSAGVGLCQASGTLSCAVDGTIACSAVAGTPQTEICGNSIDEDCNGSDLSCADVDQDGDGISANAGDCNDNNPAIYPGATELCNNVDENCNGTLDDGFNVGTSCSAGTGACSATGTLVCSANGQSTECNATPGTSSVEICDGIDNDCNGVVDNDPTDDGGACSAGVGACSAGGTYVCSSGALVCNATPGTSSAEICDGIDNNCDGNVDNDPTDDGGACSAGTGACQAGGTYVCSSGALVCNATPGSPASEICDGIDNDCNGAVDNDPTDDGGACSAGTGACQAGGTYVCNSGALVCNATPGTGSAELCDGIDNDCNGVVDNDPTDDGGACSAGTGACQAGGTYVCSSGALVCNATPGSPASEICDGIDNDCNGAVDNDPTDDGGACSAGVGACSAGGTYVCSSGALVCNATPGTSSSEICDGIDNNCDGNVDNDPTDDGGACSAGTGACQAGGTYVCSSGALVCNATPGTPASEICDGIDNDCNGAVDNDPTDDGGACSAGTGACQAGGTYVCSSGALACNATPGSPTTEVCGNGIDEDCNGSDLSCSGVDQDGDGYTPSAGDCNDDNPAVNPGATETCNAIDDNCNGTADEGFNVGTSCSAGVGSCLANGTFVCTVDGLSTQCNAVAGTPQTETCNGTDDDCNGVIDNGFVIGASCSAGVGACANNGLTVCAGDGQSTVCNAIVGTPQSETCDGADNDCNGVIDNGFNVGASCSAGSGACLANGTYVCSVDGSTTQCNATPGTGGAELCNGIDDDCNGTIDNGFDVGGACSAGVGACAVNGTLVCTANGSGTQCNAAPGTPQTEICGNGIDEDCNGSDLACTGGATDDDGDSYSEDQYDCNDANPAIHPGAAELCNGIDDDCNTFIDNGFDVGVACSAGVGYCSRTGAKVCSVDGLTTQCNVTAGNPRSEICGNGIDEDCNGSDIACNNPIRDDDGDGFKDYLGDCNDFDPTIYPNAPEICDNNIDEDCNGSDLTNCTGNPIVDDDGDNFTDSDGDCNDANSGVNPIATEICDNGIDENCYGGDLTGCSGDPNADDDNDNYTEFDGDCNDASAGINPSANDICNNGIDENCDNVDQPCTDVDDDGDGVTEDAGDCNDSNANVNPGATEICNGIDDDCDYSVDEGLGLGQSCTVGLGTCQNNGVTVCASNGQTKCSVLPLAPQSEACNSIDDDCDGEVDNLMVTCGVGICKTSIQYCTTQTCTPGTPQAEVCGNGIDEDCNGQDLSCSTSPAISGITPAGAGFGDMVTINGSGFGTDREVVKVRFSYTEGVDTHTVEQSVFSVTDSSIRVGIPLAVPNRTNEVQVLVGANASLAFNYYVGALPNDPTPGQLGNETLALVNKTSELLNTLNTKLDPWFVSTNTFTQGQVEIIRGTTFAKLEEAITRLNTLIQTMTPGQLAVLDSIIGTETFGELNNKLQTAIDALHGSPLGDIMCEGQVVQNVVDDILEVLNVIDDVLDTIQDVLTTACTVSSIIAIFTGGIATPIASFLCGAAITVVLQVISILRDIIAAVTSVLTVITEAAPVDPVDNGYSVSYYQNLWGNNFDKAYVQAATPIQIMATQDFHNEKCAIGLECEENCHILPGCDNAGCDGPDANGEGCISCVDQSEECPSMIPGYFGAKTTECELGTPGYCEIDMSIPITIAGITITVPFSLPIPHVQVPDLPIRCETIFPNGPGGVPGFTDEGTLDDGAKCLIKGADVNNAAGWVRGNYDVQVQSYCAGDVLTPGPITKTFTLVSGPKLNSINPSAVQLGTNVHVLGEYMPPYATNAGQSEISFDSAVAVPSTTNPDDYIVKTPDIASVAPQVCMEIDGRAADQCLLGQFTILPPALNLAAANPGFEGELIEVRGTGFAASIGNNALTLGGSPVSILSLSEDPSTFEDLVTFRVPTGASDGALQLTAMGVHESNLLGFEVANWEPSSLLSHPNRDANKVTMAVHDDGTVGVAWIDRHADGGKARILFTDAEPGDAAFRAPIEITDDILGSGSAAQKPDLAIAPDGKFHLVWVNAAGSLMSVSFAKGSTPTVVNHVTAATSTVGAIHDPTIAVADNGVIHVVYLDTPTDAAPHNLLVAVRSMNGGASFETPVEIEGPIAYNLPPEDPYSSVFIQYPDLSFADGTLWLAYTREGVGGLGVYGRSVITRSSTDGMSWSAYTFASPRLFLAGDFPNPANPTGPHNIIAQRNPAVSGDSNGAVVAWEAPIVGLNIDSKLYATLKVSTNREPYAIDSTMALTPTTAGYQNDNGAPSLVHYDAGGGKFLTAIAWVERITGTSPDLVNGVPRIKFNRSGDRLDTLGLNPSLTPTVGIGDTTTVNDQPSIGVDGSGNIHLAWLEGAEGARHVRYANTSNTYGNAPATDPAMVAEASRDLLIFDLNASATEDINLGSFRGTFLYDPDYPEEFRWVGVNPGNGGFDNFPPYLVNHAMSTVTSEGKLLLVGSGDFWGPTLVDMDGQQHLLASDANFDVMTDLIHPTVTPDGRIVAARPNPSNPEYELEIVINSSLLPGHFTAIGAPFYYELLYSVFGWAVPTVWPTVSYSGEYVAYNDNGEIVVLDLSNGSEVNRFSNSFDYSWSPTENKLVFVERRTSPCEQQALMEVDIPGGLNERFVTQCDGQIQGPAYKPDGTDIAYACTLCGDAAADADGGMTIKTLVGGLFVPRDVSYSNYSPVWSPDGNKIAFFTRGGVHVSMELRIWTVGEPSTVAHLGPGVGSLLYQQYFSPPIPRFPRFIWKEINQ